MQLRHRKDAGGFTLIELVVTMVVLAILAMAAQPSLRDFFDRYRLRGAGDAVVSVISNARAEAVKTNLDVAVAFSGTGANWCLGADAETTPTGGNPANEIVTAADADAAKCTCSDPASTTECRVSGQRSAVEVGAFPNIAISNVPAAFGLDNKLGTIVPLGTPAVTLTSPSGRYDVNVQMNALGQARLCTPSGKPTMAGVPPCS
jgi:prepilin-type N-terminal cleavage/methylation domain-containing protein